MKKLALMFVAFAAISLASCNGNKTAEGAATDSDSVATDTAAIETVDTLAADSVVADSAAVVAE